jgi:PAS domain S-box-containing protein
MIFDTEVLDVLLVEDDEDDYLITKALLSKAQSIDCNLRWASSYEEGLEAVLNDTFDACLVDYRLGARTGLDLLETANEHGVRTPVILLTGQGDLEVDLTAMAAGAADYLSKDEIDAPLLERSIRYAVERREAERRIREQAQLLDKARDAIMAFDIGGEVVYWNKSAERLTGWSKDETIGTTTLGEVYADGQEDTLRECRARTLEEGEWTGELNMHHEDGDDLIVESRWTLVRDSTGDPQHILVINTDITERKQLESQFLRSQRMESIGRLVGGIAHDLGNLLVPIQLGVKVLQQRYGDDEKAERTLSMIQKSAERGSDMVEQVLAFARGVEGERVSIQPDAIIEEVEKITDETFPDEIDVRADVEPDVRPIVGDATQIQQVIMNLCVNARDAMPDGGALTLRARNVALTEDDARLNIDAEPGHYVCLEVEDTGTGIPEDVVDKVFEPFFSTKPEGEGTGLGLSTAYSIVKSHDGFIDIESETGVGTLFRIYLPLAAEEAGEDVGGAVEAGELREGRGELVLVVDNEEFILDTVRETLEGAGYRALTAGGAEEALERFDDPDTEVDAVVTDLRMPHVGGIELIRRLRSRHPALPIVAASGLADGRSDEAVQAGADTFLAKPFTAEKLRGALQEVLGAEEAEEAEEGAPS